MRLHWSPKSPYVRKVIVAAHELGLLDRIQTVRSVAAMASLNPELMRDNPLGKIPALVLEDGRVLYDSLVICLYLEALGGGARLVPSAGPERWRALQRHALANGILDIAILWRHERDRPAAQRSEALQAAFAAKAGAALDQFESEPPPELADLEAITAGCVLGYLDFRFADWDWRADRPRLTAWNTAFAERPSMKATVPFD